MKRILSLLIALMLILGISSCGIKGTEVRLNTAVAGIDKYGNITLEDTATTLLSGSFSYGDIVTVEINGVTYEMPLGSNYADVDQGKMVCRLDINKESDKDRIVLAVNMGNFAETAGIATKQEAETEQGYEWIYNEGVKEPVGVTIRLKEAGGYMKEYTIRALVRTNERSDYATLSDADYANFRMIKTTGIKEGVLYRSSSPVNPELGRNTFADKELEAAGIKTVMNLADSNENIVSYGTWEDSYYSSCNVILLNLGIDTSSDEFEAGLSKGFRHFLENDGPYLMHCTEGKDRAGFASAVIECLMGADPEEVTDDYMVTYFNYYDVEKGTEQYELISDIIKDSLALSFGVEDITKEGTDLAKEAEEYFINDLGFTQEEVNTLKNKLS